VRQTPEADARPEVSRSRAWRLLVPAVAVLAGLLFATTATTAAGTELRSERRLALADLVDEREQRLADVQARARDLRAEVTAQQEAERARDSRVADAARAAEQLELQAGLVAVEGPAVTVTLDDAPRAREGAEPLNDPRPDDLVVHEQDVQAVVNALRAGGAEGMTVMGERITSTSSVRCVGNTLLLHGRVFSPPFVITAMGDPERLQAALAREPGVQRFLSYVTAYGLGYSVTASDSAVLPPYEGPLVLPSVERPAA
jgi:uncharacterized protein YlxW (UPF0749 family)